MDPPIISVAYSHVLLFVYLFVFQIVDLEEINLILII